ncbi:MAG: hypothetical protein WBL65_10895 [Bryobacteraceae bacterium]
MANRQRGRRHTAAFQIPVRPGTRIEDTRRRVFERFSEFTLAGQAFERTQVINRSIGHHMRQEMHRVGQSFRWRLEPHHTFGHG